jgi:hypothetical protein
MDIPTDNVNWAEAVTAIKDRVEETIRALMAFFIIDTIWLTSSMIRKFNLSLLTKSALLLKERYTSFA